MRKLFRFIGISLLASVLLVLTIAFAVAFLGPNAPRSTQAVAENVAAPAPQLAQVEVDANRLWRDYEANEVAADEAYKGRTLRVTGRVASIDKDLFDNIVIALAAPNEFMPTRATVQDSERAIAARLSKGVGVVVVCEGRGRVIGSPVLADCVFAR